MKNIEWIHRIKRRGKEKGIRVTETFLRPFHLWRTEKKLKTSKVEVVHPFIPVLHIHH
jgi:hypothetical protein